MFFFEWPGGQESEPFADGIRRIGDLRAIRGSLPDRGPLMTLWAATGRVWGPPGSISRMVGNDTTELDVS